MIYLLNQRKDSERIGRLTPLVHPILGDQQVVTAVPVPPLEATHTPLLPHQTCVETLLRMEIVVSVIGAGLLTVAVVVLHQLETLQLELQQELRNHVLALGTTVDANSGMDVISLTICEGTQ